MAQVPSIPKGTRDFGPLQTARRGYVFNTIQSVFGLFGYSRIETPAMENLGTLLGKYGDEGDKLLFKILNSGDAFAEVDRSLDSKALSLKICEKGLRYDLTVPFARYVVQHRNDITFPFKRYQIQPVWRADRPQKGRYREFCQCDADSIGSASLLGEVEMVQMVDEVFRRLGVRVCLKVNNRKILSGLAEVCGCPEKLTDITVAIDKIDKIGLDAVEEELRGKGIGGDTLQTVLRPVLTLKGDRKSKVAVMRRILATSATGCKGLDEIDSLFALLGNAGIGCEVELDLSLARGLNYYTGAIFEVKALDFAIGSICGGGRYDNLTGIFGLPDVSGVGISFGADRIYDVLDGLGLFPESLGTGSTLLFANMGVEVLAYILPIAARLRERGIACEIYPDSGKLKKQFEYADKKGIPFISICGTDEATSGTVNVKNLSNGEQQKFTASDIDAVIKFLTR